MESSLFNSAFEQLAIGIALVAPNGDVSYANPALCDLTGRTRHEWIEKGLSLLDLPQDWLCEYESGITIEKPVRHASGRSIWASISASPIFGEDGALLCLALQVQDNTCRKVAEDEARERSREIESILDNMEDAVVRVDRDYRYLYVNKFLRELNNGAESGLLGHTIYESGAPPEFVRKLTHHFEQVFTSGCPTEFEFDYLVEGINHNIYAHLVPECATNGEVESLLMISHDVTALKRVEAERARLIAILEESPDFVAFASPEGRILYLNRAGRSVLGLAPEETGEELTIFDVYPAWARERIKHEGLPIALRDGIWVGETAILQRDGREVPGLQTIIAHRDGFGRVEYVSTVARDITLVKQTQERLLDAQSQLEAANAELEKLAHQDALTEVGNRRLFDEGLRAAVELAQESGEPFSLVMLDVDHFKQFNDLHGHPAGDDILREVARILQCTLWPSDVVTRYGGEEFGLLLPATGVTGSIRAAERCRRAIESAPWRLRPITASFGVATWEGEDAQTILVRADLALYTAKQAGRNCVRHSNG